MDGRGRCIETIGVLTPFDVKPLRVQPLHQELSCARTRSLGAAERRLYRLFR
jgi:hypothetical protein